MFLIINYFFFFHFFRFIVKVYSSNGYRLTLLVIWVPSLCVVISSPLKEKLIFYPSFMQKVHKEKKNYVSFSLTSLVISNHRQIDAGFLHLSLLCINISKSLQKNLYIWSTVCPKKWKEKPLKKKFLLFPFASQFQYHIELCSELCVYMDWRIMKSVFLPSLHSLFVLLSEMSVFRLPI